MPATHLRERLPNRPIEVCLLGADLALRYLRPILEAEPIFRVVSEKEKSSSREGPELRPCVFIVDTYAIGDSLGKYFRSLRASAPGCKIIILGKELPEEELCSLLFLGIDGFVPYKDVPDKISLAVQAVSQGHQWIDPSVLERFLSYSRIAARAHGRTFASGAEQSSTGRHALTARENLIFGLLQRWFSNKEIASALGISENTVKFHVSNVFAKLGVHDRHSLHYLVDSHAPDDADLQRLLVAEAKFGSG